MHNVSFLLHVSENESMLLNVQCVMDTLSWQYPALRSEKYSSADAKLVLPLACSLSASRVHTSPWIRNIRDRCSGFISRDIPAAKFNIKNTSRSVNCLQNICSLIYSFLRRCAIGCILKSKSRRAALFCRCYYLAAHAADRRHDNMNHFV